MMILLFSDDSIKVVIHTGNLIEHDWRSKTLAIYTTPFLHFKSPSTPPATSDALQHSPSSDFERMLLQYLDSYRDETVDEWRKRLEKYDFGECRAMLIPSVPGIHTGSSLNDYGMNRLKQIVEQQDQSGKHSVPEVSREGVVVQIPSLSNIHPVEYSYPWLSDFLHALTHSEWQSTELKSDFSHDSDILADSENMQELMAKVTFQLNESDSEERLNLVPSNSMLRKYIKGSSDQMCPPCLSLSPNSQMTTMTQFLIPSSSSSRNPLSSVSSTLASDQLSDNPQLQDATVHLSYHLFTSADLSKSSWGVPVLRRAGLSIRNWDMGVAVCDSLFKSKYHNKIYLVPSSSPLLQPPPSQTSFSSSQSPSTSQPHQIPPFPYPLPPLPPFPSRSSPLNSPSPPSLSSLFVSNPQSSTSSSSGSSSTYFSTIPSSTINSTQPSSPFPSSSAPSPFLASDGPVLIVPIPMSIPITSSSPSPVKFEKM
ncbi:tyrosyl-DNA phosphodiesterase-domain-containing protein [Paraphysoderma sedebokerense]|nr:tyrosyl-DNA phosphodiesterase-domain-containing protein [Paraphysoderma sedebokerense]